MGLIATNKWTIKFKNMTYIVGGKINNKAFILVDKVVNDNPNESTDKLYNSISNSDIYISLTGDGELMDFIKEYDSELNQNDEKLTIDKKFIEDITTRFLSKYSEDISKKTSLYIINIDDFIRVDINFDNHKFIDYQIIDFNNNEFSLCNSINKEICDINVSNIEDFSKFFIKKTFETVNSKYGFDDYFINGFDYIEK